MKLTIEIEFEDTKIGRDDILDKIMELDEVYNAYIVLGENQNG